MAHKVVLDEYNSDLNLVILDRGYGAHTLNHPRGFRLMWAGARATYGVCKGKVFFEVKIESYQDAQCDGGHAEQHSHLVRVGWSSNASSFTLGEDNWSFGYGGTGKFSNRGNFLDYGESFGRGDVIGAMLDLDSRPASLSFMKNGRHFGVAIKIPKYKTGQSNRALFPHILLKNCHVKINFGQTGAWFAPPRGFLYMEQISAGDKVRGSTAPSRKSECEVIMTVGLPGSGKTSWAESWKKRNPEKGYNIMGTDKIMDDMRVMGITKAYANRWQLLISMATECLNAILPIAASRNRNYILDQTNVYASARKKKMASFSGFRRTAVVVQPNDGELVRRSQKRTKETRKDVPVTEVRKMKANYSLPTLGDNLFDKIEYAELPQAASAALVARYNRENAQYKRD